MTEPAARPTVRRCMRCDGVIYRRPNSPLWLHRHDEDWKDNPHTALPKDRAVNQRKGKCMIYRVTLELRTTILVDAFDELEARELADRAVFEDENGAYNAVATDVVPAVLEPGERECDVYHG